MASFCFYRRMTSFSPADVRSFFDSHWTVRKYKSLAMPREHLDVILHAAQRAPTDATAQTYSFIRLTDPALRALIAELAANPHIATASEAFIICGDLHRLQQTLRSNGYEPAKLPTTSIHFAIGDAVMAGENMLIASEMLGYRGCWIGGVISNVVEISKLLSLPPAVFPFAGLTIGVPDEDPQHRPRLPRPFVIHENHYAEPIDLQKGIKDMGAITARGDWAQTLARYFAEGGSMVAREKLLTEFMETVVKPAL